MKRKSLNISSQMQYTFTLVIFVIAIGFAGDYSIAERVVQKNKIETLQTNIAELESQYERDSTSLHELKLNPEAIKKYAHNRYFMKTSDEDVFVIKDE